MKKLEIIVSPKGTPNEYSTSGRIMEEKQTRQKAGGI